jgi:hypothetical protein
VQAGYRPDHAEALLLAMTGRPVALGDLDGAGVLRLTARIRP